MSEWEHRPSVFGDFQQEIPLPKGDGCWFWGQRGLPWTFP